MAQFTSNQHVIPASFLGNFAKTINSSSSRKSIVFVQRDGKEIYSTQAENVGMKKNIYTIANEGFGSKDYIDKTWDYVENKLPNATSLLAEHTDSYLFDAIIWSTVIVPFVSQLFVREIDYSHYLEKRAPWLKDVFDDSALKDNNNMNRLIDYQLNCGLLVDAEWRLVHNRTSVPLITNDRGYGLFDASIDGGPAGYLVPFNKEIMIMIAKKPIEIKTTSAYKIEETHKIMLPQIKLSDERIIRAYNGSMASCARSEIYGAEESILMDAWSSRYSKAKIDLGGPTLIQQKHLSDMDMITYYGEFLDLLNLSPEIRKGAFAGKEVYILEGEDGKKIKAFGFRDL
ncbi:DUF4238 domain-containing protein [Paenibacillus taichungensis]|uniref:DUF4238 domain-containing protein n=1 Tax=Paenibacillus taichungensis TaxID=484184 RepID=A0ABX2MLE6_9BACL|nr:DUF4238 domain-containing protein [Paenibacillus taichungensis]NUU54845.1 DUF4238 domain-containing protein [Paenibacillus taichungensis]